MLSSSTARCIRRRPGYRFYWYEATLEHTTIYNYYHECEGEHDHVIHNLAPSSHGKNVQHRCTGVFSALVKGMLTVRVSFNSSHTDESKYHLSSAEPIGGCGGRAVECSAMAESNNYYSSCQYSLVLF